MQYSERNVGVGRLRDKADVLGLLLTSVHLCIIITEPPLATDCLSQFLYGISNSHPI